MEGQEYDIDSFVARLRELMYDNFPKESDDLLKAKHKTRKGHFRDIVFKDLPITMNIDARSFDLGSPYGEATMPQYHILQQAEVIAKKGRGTTKTKGSQDTVSNKMERDYERVNWNGKTFSKEYSKNVRGSRSKADKIRSVKLRYTNGEYVAQKGIQDKYYINIHYQYIDRTLDAITPFLASEFGMKLRRKQDVGLDEEYQMQQDSDSPFSTDILDIMDSFDDYE